MVSPLTAVIIFVELFFNLTNQNLDLGQFKVNYRADYDLVNCL